MLDYKITPLGMSSSNYMHINILDSKELKFEALDGIEVTELSALAYKDSTLYALSDKGYLYHFEIGIKKSKIKKLSLKKAFKLKNKSGKKLKKKKRDSEGLVFLGDNLLISFERKHRVELFSLNSVKIKKIKINKSLRDSENYESKNKGLEAVAYSKKYGVITAPELPLKNEDQEYHTLYAKDKTWKFKAEGSITALEFMDRERILVLLREFNEFSRKRVTTLCEINLNNCKKSVCKSKVLARLDSSDGWSIDNFEGLARISDNRYLMISDDNGSFFQKTLLVLFEIVD
ncbi:MAG: esterase-like activity of phytase family protein [Sulfurimonas sp.]|nr:esterase-like activity of phytase family protein [Sulfurimonas sp.]